ncbi:MAG: hypothetical protein KAS32_06825 [Candidatus Peribacteraceae bacterium]|nr:hypothetical protein [Candidatus Peribacteraceae bacterium]
MSEKVKTFLSSLVVNLFCWILRKHRKLMWAVIRQIIATLSFKELVKMNVEIRKVVQKSV